MSCKRCTLAARIHLVAENGDTFHCPDHGVMVYWAKSRVWRTEIPLDSVEGEVSVAKAAQG